MSQGQNTQVSATDPSNSSTNHGGASTAFPSKLCMVFKKKPGTNDLGKDYEHLFIANLVLKLVLDKSVENFYLSSNHPDFGAFDDVVVEIKYVGQEQLVVYALQLKHCESKVLRTHHLQAQDGDFSINKYFSEKKLQDVKTVLLTNCNETINDTIQLKLNNEEVTVKVLKTRQIDLLKQKLCKQTELLATSEKGISYTFESQTHQDFFENFSLYTNQANVNVIEKRALNLFEKEFGGDENIFNRFVNVITRWSMRRKKNKLDKDFMKEQLFLLLTSPFTKTLAFSTNTPVGDRQHTIREALAKFEITFLKKVNYANIKNLWQDVVNSTNVLNEINQKNNEYFISLRRISNEGELNGEDKEISLLFWLVGKCPLILEGCPQVYKALEICNQLNLIILEDSDKLILKSTFRNLSDLKSNKEIYEKIINSFTYSIEGQAETPLKQLIQMDNRLEVEITVDQITKILNGPLLIGNQQEKLPPCHIPRKLTRILVDYQLLKNLDKNDIALITEVKDEKWLPETISHAEQLELDTFSNDNKVVYFIKNDISEEDFTKICSKKTSKGIHQFKYVDKMCLEWIRSNVLRNEKVNSINKSFGTINRFRLGDDYTSNVLSESQMFGKDENDINVICANPGMGKSTIAKSLKNSSSSEVWTIVIYVRNHGQHLKASKGNVSKFMEHVLALKSNEQNDKLDDKLKKIFMEKNRIRLIWDGLDEVSESSLKIILDLIEAISSNGGVKQWLTSRNNLKNGLEKRFNTFARDLKQFNEQEQQDYIRDRLKLTDSELAEMFPKIKLNIEMCSNNDILGIPLQIFMLTELLSQDREKYLLLLNGFFTILNLYEHFVDEQFRIFFEGKRNQNLNNDRNLEFFENEKKNQIKCHQDIAFHVHVKGWLAKTITELLSSGSQFNKCDEVGLIKPATNFDDVEFMHNSYGEYFAALYLFENNRQKARESSFISNERYSNIRFFLDLMLTQNSKPAAAILCRNYTLFEQCCKKDLNVKDLIGRDVLELSCAWNKQFSILRFQQDSKFEFNSGLKDKTELLNYPVIRRVFDKIFSSIEDSKMKLLVFFPFLIPLYDETRQDFDPTYLPTILNYAIKLDNTLLFDLIQNSIALKSCYVYNIKPESVLSSVLSCKSSKVLNKIIRDERCRFLLLTNLRDFLKNLSQEHEEMFKYLINLQNIEGKMPIHYACAEGDVESVKWLTARESKLDVPDKFGQLPIHYACEKANLEIVEHLLSLNSPVNVPDKKGQLPIHIACNHKNSSEIVKLLFKEGAKLDVPDLDGVLPLHYACRNTDNSEIVEFLLENNPAIDVPDLSGVLPIHYVCLNRRAYSTIKFLLANGAKIDVPDSNGLLPLHYACKNIIDSEILELLLKNGARADVPCSKGLLPMHYACYNSEGLQAVQVLMQYAASINHPDSKGQLPIHYACKNVTGFKIVKFLFDMGANICVPDLDGSQPIHLSCGNSCGDEIVKFLVENGAPVDVPDSSGILPIHYACENAIGRQSIKSLLEIGAKINGPDAKGALPMHYACKNRHTALTTVKFLLENGAEINVPDSNGLLPIHYAFEILEDRSLFGLDIVKLLLESGTRIDIPDLQGVLPLHYACKCIRGLSTVKMLLMNGAKVNAPDSRGALPLHYACANFHGPDIVKFLLENGARVDVPDCNGSLPIHVACRNQSGHSHEVVDLLLKNGAKLDVPDAKGVTPKQYAVYNKGTDAHKLILMILDFSRLEKK